jgi:hypothetical protein
LFATTHLQSAHFLPEYVGSLHPQVKDISHLGGNSVKNYVDAIIRKMKNVENGKATFSSFYGNWSWNTNTAPVKNKWSQSQQRRLITKDTTQSGQV